MVSNPQPNGRPPGWLSVSAFSAGPCLVVVVAGEADCATAPQLRDQLTAALAYGPRTLVLDLTDLEFCNLRGLRALLGVVEGAQEAGVDVVMRGMSRQLSCLQRRYADYAGSGGQSGRTANENFVSPSAAVRSTSPV